MEHEVEICTEAQLTAWQCLGNTSRLMDLAPSAIVSNNEYLIVAFLIRADPRKFLLLFFSRILLKTVFEVNRQRPTFAPFFHSVPHVPLQGNFDSFLISYLGPQMEVHPEVWPRPAGQCHLGWCHSLGHWLSQQAGQPSQRLVRQQVLTCLEVSCCWIFIAFVVPTANGQVVVTDLLISPSLAAVGFSSYPAISS